MSTLGVSGCFGSSQSQAPIDDIDDVSQVVDDIVGTPEDEADVPVDPAPDLALAELVEQYVRRVRLLTWAVIALSIVAIIREVD